MPMFLAAAVAGATSQDIENGTEAVNNAAELINEYGPTVAILAVFLVIFIAMIALILRANSKMNSKMLDAQQAANAANQKMMQDLFQTFLGVVKAKTNSDDDDDDKEDDEKPEPESKEKDKKKKKIVSSYIDSSLAFKDASRIAMSKIRCERIAIYLFHNGNHTPYGYPFAKMSCVHEWTMRGSNTIRGYNHVNIPLYAFSTIVEALVKDGEFVVSNIYDHGIVSADEQIFQFISGSTIRSLFALAIKDADGELAAFTIAEFKEAQDFSAGEVYNTVKNALKTMNDNIYSIVVNDTFRDNYTEKPEDSK